MMDYPLSTYRSQGAAVDMTCIESAQPPHFQVKSPPYVCGNIHLEVRSSRARNSYGPRCHSGGRRCRVQKGRASPSGFYTYVTSSDGGLQRFPGPHSSGNIGRIGGNRWDHLLPSWLRRPSGVVQAAPSFQAN